MKITATAHNRLTIQFGSYMPYVWFVVGLLLTVAQSIFLIFNPIGSFQFLVLLLSIAVTLIVTTLLFSMSEHFKMHIDKDRALLIFTQGDSQVLIPYDNLRAIWVNRIMSPDKKGETLIQVHIIRYNASPLEIYSGKFYTGFVEHIEKIHLLLPIPVYITSITDKLKEGFLGKFANLTHALIDISPETRIQANTAYTPIRISHRGSYNIKIFANDDAIWLEWSVVKMNTLFAILLSLFVCIIFIYTSFKFFVGAGILGYLSVIIGVVLLCFASYSLLYFYLSRQVIFIDANKLIYRKTLFSSQEEITIPIKEIKRSQGNLINQHRSLCLKMESNFQENDYESVTGELFYTANPFSWEHTEIDLQSLFIGERFLLEDVVLEMIESSKADADNSDIQDNSDDLQAGHLKEVVIHSLKKST
ncbi:MAG: hypothetical protein EAZ08_05080 [Cytophagales bacterium]|nr:MAG: hypothetical protein EAZ08_05080 [Cytophagales bacterium]